MKEFLFTIDKYETINLQIVIKIIKSLLNTIKFLKSNTNLNKFSESWVSTMESYEQYAVAYL